MSAQAANRRRVVFVPSPLHFPTLADIKRAEREHVRLEKAGYACVATYGHGSRYELIQP